jgi:hypothetical protein
MIRLGYLYDHRDFFLYNLAANILVYLASRLSTRLASRLVSRLFLRFNPLSFVLEGRNLV